MPVPTIQPTAEQLFEAGRFEESLAAWRQVGLLDPASTRAQGRIGACLIALGRHAEAAAALAPLAAAMPDQPVVLYRYAVALAGAGHTEDALGTLERASAAGVRLISGLDTEPAFLHLRAQPRFVAIRDRMVRNDAPTADDPRFRSFDFWVGSWEARTEDGVLQGHNRIERALGGAAIVERWTGATGVRGMSLNRVDRATGTWRQTWVDDQGDVVEFVDGVASERALVFGAVDPDGSRRRLTFEAGGPDAFRQLSEQSTDDGVTWTVEYDFRYRRLPDGVAEAAHEP